MTYQEKTTMDLVLDVADFREKASGYVHSLACTTSELISESICICERRPESYFGCTTRHRPHHFGYERPNGTYSIGKCECGLKRISANTRASAIKLYVVNQMAGDVAERYRNEQATKVTTNA